MQVSLSLVRTLAANLVRARIARRTFVSPFAVAWHATNACNLQCSYCDDGRGRRYPDLGGRVMATADVKHVLSLAREAVSVLYITGGEPLLRNDLAEVVAWAKRDARFGFVGLATNGTLLHRQESILEHVDEIEISLDSLDHEEYDSVLNAGAGTSRTIIDAVLRYHALAPERGYHLGVTCVAMPGRVRHARDVVRFCFERGIPCGVLPQSKGPYPEAGLLTDPATTGPRTFCPMWRHRRTPISMLEGIDAWGVAVQRRTGAGCCRRARPGRAPYGRLRRSAGFLIGSVHG